MRAFLLLTMMVLLGCPDRGTKEPAPAPSESTAPTAAKKPVESKPEIALVSEPQKQQVERLRERVRGGPTKVKTKPKSATPPPIDLSCETAKDCAVKNVGNCCGYYPRCVNVDFEPDPKAVQAQCEREGRMGVCGFAEVKSCTCEAKKCVSHSESVE